MKKYYIPAIVLAIFLAGCTVKPPDIQVHQQNYLPGLASPVNLQPGTTTIYLSDYFPGTSVIDSISIGDATIPCKDDPGILVYHSSPDLPTLSEMKVWVDSIAYSILIKKSRKVPYTFVYDPGDSDYKQVQISGTINGWNPSATPMEMADGRWQADVMLYPGVYQYLLVADGRFMLDPANPDSVDNNMGGFNSVVTVGEIDKSKAPMLSAIDEKGTKISIRAANPVDEIFVFWENYRLGNEFLQNYGLTYNIKIPTNATNMERSYIRVWAYNKNGVSNDLLIPLSHGRVVKHTDQLDRTDWETMIIYNIMVDRFYDGDSTNDFPVPDPEIRPKANYFGGDIKGITEKIRDGFFDDLGVNTLWISPVVRNAEGAWGLFPDPRSKFSGYHGYWPISFTQVDYRFGTGNDLKELMETAHANGINVLLDFVAHHIHKDHPMYQEHPGWFTDLYLPDGSLNTERWDEYRLTTWFDVFLPTLDLARTEVYEMLSDSAVFWIKEFNLDGFRHDATKHVPEVFWRTLTRKLKEQIVIPEHRTLYQIGETYGNGEMISSYVGSGQQDGQFDFNVYDAAIAVFGRETESFTRLQSTLTESFDYYGYHNLMGYISGNQDRARFISYAGGALGWDENGKYAGWTRDIEVGDPVGYYRMAQLMAFNMTIPGIPVIFYGDEIGMPGGNDPDNRRMMRFSNLNSDESSLRETIKKLITLRNNNMALLYGDFILLELSDKTYAFARLYFDEMVVAVFNKSNESEQIVFTIPERFAGKKIQSHFGAEVMLKGDEVNVDIGGNGFDVLLLK